MLFVPIPHLVRVFSKTEETWEAGIRFFWLAEVNVVGSFQTISSFLIEEFPLEALFSCCFLSVALLLFDCISVTVESKIRKFEKATYIYVFSSHIPASASFNFSWVLCGSDFHLDNDVSVSLLANIVNNHTKIYETKKIRILFPFWVPLVRLTVTTNLRACSNLIMLHITVYASYTIYSIV